MMPEVFKSTDAGLSTHTLLYRWDYDGILCQCSVQVLDPMGGPIEIESVWIYVACRGCVHNCAAYSAGLHTWHLQT